MAIKKILVTGGAGFIGSNLCEHLLAHDYEVVCLDNFITGKIENLLPLLNQYSTTFKLIVGDIRNLSKQIHGANPDKTSPLYNSIKNKVHFIEGSVTNREDWLKAIDSVDCIVHLAAETGTGQSMYEIEKYVGVNIGGTALMLDILTNTNHTVKKVVVAESRAIYGEGRYYSKELNQFVYPTERSEAAMRAGDFEVKYKGCDSPLKLVGTTEDSMIHPTSVYGITKQVQGQLVHLVCPSIGIASVSYRYQNVYGPGQSLSNPYTGILSIFSTRIRNGNGINIFEDGKETRDFVYIDDVVDATILGIEKEEANGHVFNVGTGVATDVLTVARTLIEKYEIDVPVTISGNFRLGDIRHNYADITAARTILGFEPKWSFSDGIGEFVKWVNEQGVQEDKYEASIEEMKKKGLYK